MTNEMDKIISDARKVKGGLTDILLQILADKPSAIVNAWEEIITRSENPFPD